MARSEKNTVDYFPHMVIHGKTMFIVESKFGNDGYATVFKLFELLGANENHYFDCRNDENMEFLLAKMKLNQTLLNDIFSTLSNCGTIHKELWSQKILWSGKFLKNIEDVYKRRNTNCMHFDDLCKHLKVKCKHKYNSYGVIVDEKPQSKVEESKVEESNQIYSDFSEKFQNHKKQIQPEIMKGINPSIKACAETVRLLIEEDGFTIDELRKVLQWSLNDDFWKNQIKSLSGLRSKGKNGLTKFVNCRTAYLQNINEKPEKKIDPIYEL